jgi:FAD/FMN-containing dehydrogenase
VIVAQSWGRYPRVRAAREAWLYDRHAPLPIRTGESVLAHGLGRSYGDLALNEGAGLLRTRGLDKFISFDRVAGVLRAEAGVSLEEILALVVPHGWFLPVTPGTRFVTLGGAVANDVHGKNHHAAGSFGHHVRALELVRSDQSRIVCGPDQSAELFRATIGGMGLTGLITWVEIGLQAIAAPWVQAINRRFAHIEDYWAVDAELGARHAMAVAWVDCLQNGRGIYSAGDFAAGPELALPGQAARLAMPFDPPFSLINALSLKAFNWAYFHKPLATQAIVPAQQYFYPLDAVRDWNRIYGRKGFVQYQCVLPPSSMRGASVDLLQCLRRHGQGSFLAVLKTFGKQAGAGVMSFPRPGVTLAVDLPMRDQATLALCNELDAVVRAAGGALYPAKDARMSPAMFRQSFPGLDAFVRHVDPAFSSSFWRRVML